MAERMIGQHEAAVAWHRAVLPLDPTSRVASRRRGADARAWLAEPPGGMAVLEALP